MAVKQEKHEAIQVQAKLNLLRQTMNEKDLGYIPQDIGFIIGARNDEGIT